MSIKLLIKSVQSVQCNTSLSKKINNKIKKNIVAHSVTVV